MNCPLYASSSGKAKQKEVAAALALRPQPVPDATMPTPKAHRAAKPAFQ